ncbi:glutamate receptor U1-like [Mytilus edulis]|uniref:glutamate receptor U1-like n=1 Tax=Mytilus edulis TaxID=6550 RepID=UPI0039EE076F
MDRWYENTAFLLVSVFYISATEGLTDYRVTTILNPPLVMSQGDGSSRKFVGLLPDLLDKIGPMMSATFSLTHVQDSRYGTLDNTGNWTGMIGELVNKKADIAAAGLTVTVQRANAVHFSQPILDSGLSIVMKKPTANGISWKRWTGLLSFLKPFTTGVWIAVICSYAIVSLLYGIILQFDPMEEDGTDSIKKNITRGFPVMFYRFCFQGSFSPSTCTSRSAKMLTCFWCIFVILIFASYITSLAGVFRSGDDELLETPIHSFEDLPLQSEIEYGVAYNSMTYRYFTLNAKDKTDEAIGKQLKKSKDQMPKTVAEGVKRVRDSKGDYVFITEELYARTESGKPPCDLVLVHHSKYRGSYSFACGLESKACHDLDVALVSLKENGILEELVGKWYKNQCDTDFDDNYIKYVTSFEDKKFQAGLFFRTDGISIDKIGSLFILLLLGILISIGLLIFDICFEKRFEKKMRGTARDDQPFESITNDMQ